MLPRYVLDFPISALELDWDVRRRVYTKSRCTNVKEMEVVRLERFYSGPSSAQILNLLLCDVLLISALFTYDQGER